MYTRKYQMIFWVDLYMVNNLNIIYDCKRIDKIKFNFPIVKLSTNYSTVNLLLMNGNLYNFKCDLCSEKVDPTPVLINTNVYDFDITSKTSAFIKYI